MGTMLFDISNAERPQAGNKPVAALGPTFVTSRHVGVEWLGWQDSNLRPPAIRQALYP